MLECDASTITEFPEAGDWEGWIDVWCRDDTGAIDCVPACLRPAIIDQVTADGVLIDPEIFPGTPYKLARWFHIGPGNPLPPWHGSGLTPTQVRQIWEDASAAIAVDETPQRSVEPEACSEPAPVVQEEYDWPDLYFIGSAGGPIKIGISVDPAKRVRQLQTGYPYELKVFATVRGGCLLEPEYHARFAAHRLQGEWFNPHPEVLAEIERLNANAL